MLLELAASRWGVLIGPLIGGIALVFAVIVGRVWVIVPVALIYGATLALSFVGFVMRKQKGSR